ncbi:MAG: folylpolyglutamate synthase/dihydrofolate synthase family protein [Myxococcota bacterium]|nr:folylpolyglutamate synthase/dihydrofolate synthase family protein [Myxococcota bacterium]
MISHPVLSRLAAGGIRLGLERIESFLEDLGSPHLAFPVLHVAGTNGKGSVCAMAASMLQAQGLRVGVTTSPHLQAVNERIQVDGVSITDAELDVLIAEVETRACDWAARFGEWEADDGPPLTYFEAVLAAAFLHFQRKAVEVAVVEVGLGGRLDATSVVSPTVSVITSIGLDHMEQLGPDLASVAAEKCGIMREGVPVVVGALPAEAALVVRAMGSERGAPQLELGRDFGVSGGHVGFSYERGAVSREGLALGLHGLHQVENAGVAITAVELMGERVPQLAVGESALRRGLEQARHPGRLEWVEDGVLVDGCHNAHAAERLAQYLRGLSRDGSRSLLLGCSREKDVRSIAAVLAPEVDQILTTSCAHPRSLEPDALAEALEGLGCPVRPSGPVEQALPFAQNQGGIVIAAGSLFLVGAVRDLLAPQ